MAASAGVVFACLLLLLLHVSVEIISQVVPSTSTPAVTTTMTMQKTEPPPTSPPPKVECGAEGARCWAKGGLWHRPSGTCQPPLSQVKCEDGQWLVANASGPPDGACAAHACPPALFPSKGRCLEEGEAREMCWSRAVHLDATGVPRCGKHPGWVALLAARGLCTDNVTAEAYDSPTAFQVSDNVTYGGVYGANVTAFNGSRAEDLNMSAVSHPGSVNCPFRDDGLCPRPIDMMAGAGAPETTFGFSVACVLVSVLLPLWRNQR